MHNCEEFRERITEHIIDREELESKSEFHTELLLCSGCSEFYAQSREMMEALSEIDLSISESQWNRIEQRLDARIRNAEADRLIASLRPSLAVAALPPPQVRLRDYIQTPILAAASILLLITIGLARLGMPITGFQTPGEDQAPVYVEHAVPLDPVTVDFLEESELLLRNVMKMGPKDVEDLADAKKTADEQLAELEQRKEAAADVPPVVGVMETYETVLRDLRNIDEHRADEDINDIQTRIRKNGLIANIKAFQPRVTEVSFGR
jgi:hypothetical protein